MLQKKQKLVKAGSSGSAEKVSRGKAFVKKESTQLDDAVEEARPHKQPKARTPQQPQTQKHDLQTAESDDDDSAPAITG